MNTKTLIRKTFLMPVLVVAVLAAIYGPSQKVTDVTFAPLPHVPSAAETTAVSHGCWSHEAPADMVGKFPGHVVWPDGTYGGPADVSKALETVFNNAPGEVPFAFCR